MSTHVNIAVTLNSGEAYLDEHSKTAENWPAPCEGGAADASATVVGRQRLHVGADGGEDRYRASVHDANPRRWRCATEDDDRILRGARELKDETVMMDELFDLDPDSPYNQL
jgi:hypothetical protein